MAGDRLGCGEGCPCSIPRQAGEGRTPERMLATVTVATALITIDGLVARLPARRRMLRMRKEGILSESHSREAAKR